MYKVQGHEGRDGKMLELSAVHAHFHPGRLYKEKEGMSEMDGKEKRQGRGACKEHRPQDEDIERGRTGKEPKEMKEETMDKRSQEGEGGKEMTDRGSQEGEGGEAMTDMTETVLDSKVRAIFNLLDSVMDRTLEKNEVKIQILDLCNMALGIAYGQKYYVGKKKEG